jgi:hypothetical protein
MAGDQGLARYQFERSEGVPEASSIFARFTSESFTMGRPYEPDPNLDPSGNETAGDGLKAEGTGTLVAAPNSESLLQMRIEQHGFYDLPVAPAVGTTLWELRDFDETSDTPLDHYVDSLSMGFWRDEQSDASEYNILGYATNEFTCAVDANKHVRYERAGLFLRDRYIRNPVEVAVNAAFTGFPVSRGHWQGGEEGVVSRKFKVVTPGDFGVATIVWGEGAGAYGVTPYIIVDDWMDQMKPTDARVGTRLEPAQIRFVKNDPGDLFTAGDEWTIFPTSPKPVPSYSVRPKLNGTALEIRFSNDGGVNWFTKQIDTFTLKMGTPREAKFSLGSKYAQFIGFPDNSKRWWEISFGRDYVDRDFAKALISGRTISAYLKLWGAPIGATGEEDYAEFTLDRTKLSQAGATVTSPGSLPENPVLRAFSENLSPLCIERYLNTVTDVHPA